MKNLIMKIIISLNKIMPLTVLKFKINEAIKKIRYKIKEIINYGGVKIKAIIDYVQTAIKEIINYIKATIKPIIDYIQSKAKIKAIIDYIKVKIKPIIDYIQSKAKVTLFCFVGFIFLVLIGWKIEYDIANFERLLNPKPLFPSFLLLLCGLGLLKLYKQILLPFIKDMIILSLKDRHVITLVVSIFSLLFLGAFILVPDNYSWQSLGNDFDLQSLGNSFGLLDNWQDIYDKTTNILKMQSLYLLIPFIASFLVILGYILYAVGRFLSWVVLFLLSILLISLYLLLLFYYILLSFEILKYLLPY